MDSQEDQQMHPRAAEAAADAAATTEEPSLVIISELDDFAAQLIAPNVKWFNDSLDRAEQLASMLLPNRHGTSLRLADHLVVQYSRDHVIIIQVEPVGDAGECGVPTELWLDYRRILSCTGKRYFDVFKRKNSIRARLLGVEIITTVGQIVFLAWYQKRGLHNYMAKHETDVREHMQRVERSLKSVPNTPASSPTSGRVGSAACMSSPGGMSSFGSPGGGLERLTAEAFKRAGSDSVVTGRKRKSRAPSKSDFVKPATRLYEGPVVLKF